MGRERSRGSGRRRRSLGVLLVASSLASAPVLASAEWAWSGAAWADYRAFMSPLTAPVKNHLRAIRTSGAALGRVEGRMGQIGDSITYAGPYFRNAVLYGPTGNQTGYGYAGIRSWLAYAGAMPADANSFYDLHGKGPAYGNFSGWSVADAVAAGHPGAAVTVGDGATPGDFSWALLMFGTNDIDGPPFHAPWDLTSWVLAYTDFVQEFIDLGVIPVLSTIPPEGAHIADGRVEEANAAIRALADEMKIPCVDFYALVLHYQPVNWIGTLIGPDGTHPSAAGGGRDFSQTGLTTTDGYAARTKLSLDFAAKLRAIVFDNGLPEPGPNELFSDDFESGDASAWSAGFPASAIAVDPAAAFSGALGLAVTLDGCSPSDVVLGPAESPISGEHVGCRTLFASGVEVAAAGATLTAGAELALGEGVGVGLGAPLTIGFDAALAAPFAYVEDDSPANADSYDAVFHANLDNLDLTAGDELDLLVGSAANGEVLFRLIARYDPLDDENELAIAARLDDGSFAQTPLGEESVFPSGYNMIEVAWLADDGGGSLGIAIESAPLSGLESLTNGLLRLETVRLGLVGGVVNGSSGMIYLDEFQSFQ